MTPGEHAAGVAVLRLETFRPVGGGVAAQGGIGNWLAALGERVPRLIALLPVVPDAAESAEAGRAGIWTPRRQDVLLALPDLRGYWRVARHLPSIVAGLREARRSADVLICRVPEHGSWLTLPVATLLGFRVVLWVVADRAAARQADRLRRDHWGARLGRMVNRLAGWVERRYLLRCPVITNGEVLAEQVARLRGSSDAVRHVISSNLRASDLADTGLRADHGVAPCALYVGRIAPDKGILDLLKAWRIVRDHPAGARAVLHLVGWSSFGEEARLRREAGTLGLDEDAVAWHAPMPYGPGLWAYYREATVFVLASHTEGTPRVVGEALAFGVPVVATAAGSTARMLQDGGLGFLVPVGDPAALAAAVLVVLSDPDRRRVLSVRGRAAGASWTVEAVADEFARVLQGLGVPIAPASRTARPTQSSWIP